MKAPALLVVSALTLALVGSTSAASGKPKLIRVVKRDGAITATLTYRERGGVTYRPTLSVVKNGHLMLAHRMCPLDWGGNAACTWGGPDAWWYMNHGPGVFRNLVGRGSPAVVVDLYLGGAHCCVQSFIALTGPKQAWIAHDWKNPGYRDQRIGGRYYFVSGDNRFDYAFTSYAFSWAPAQVWAIRHERLVDVTRSVPSLVAADASHAWRTYLKAFHQRPWPDDGALAGWCADEYLLREGGRCTQTVARELAAGHLNGRTGQATGHAFIRLLNRDLVHWGYTRR